MRKTLIIALAGMLSVEANAAATNITYTATEAGTTVSLPNDITTENLPAGFSGTIDDVKKAITTEGNTDYYIKYQSGTTNDASLTFNITDQLYVQGVSNDTSTAKYITSRTWNIKDNAGLTSSANILFAGSADKDKAYKTNVSVGNNAYIKSANLINFGTYGSNTVSITMGSDSAISAKTINFSVSGGTADISINFGTSGTTTQSAITSTNIINLVTTSTLNSLALTTTLTSDELTALATPGNVVSRKLISSGSYIRGEVTDTNTTLTLSNLSGKAYGGVLVMLVEDGSTSYYKRSDTTYSEIGTSFTYSINDGAQAVTLADNTAYTYIEIGSTSKATTIGMLVTTPEPATATLSLLALAGLCARRRRR